MFIIFVYIYFCGFYSDFQFDYVKILFVLLFIFLEFNLFIEMFYLSFFCILITCLANLIYASFEIFTVV